MRLDQLRLEKRLVSWSDLCPILDRNFVRIVASIPFIGYLIIFNDQIGSFFEFNKITGGSGTLLLNTKARLQFIYFGLIGLSIAIVWLRLRCPSEVRKFPDKADYVRTNLQDLSIFELARIYLILEEKYGFGKFDDVPYSRADLNRLIDASSPKMTPPAETLTDDEIWLSMPNVTDPRAGKSVSEEFLKFLLNANYDYKQLSRRAEAHAIFSFLVIVLLLLAIPSLDVFISITIDVVASLLNSKP